MEQANATTRGTDSDPIWSEHEQFYEENDRLPHDALVSLCDAVRPSRSQMGARACTTKGTLQTGLKEEFDRRYTIRPTPYLADAVIEAGLVRVLRAFNYKDEVSIFGVTRRGDRDDVVTWAQYFDEAQAQCEDRDAVRAFYTENGRPPDDILVSICGRVKARCEKQRQNFNPNFFIILSGPAQNFEFKLSSWIYTRGDLQSSLAHEFYRQYSDWRGAAHAEGIVDAAIAAGLVCEIQYKMRHIVGDRIVAWPENYEEAKASVREAERAVRKEEKRREEASRRHQEYEERKAQLRPMARRIATSLAAFKSFEEVWQATWPC